MKQKNLSSFLCVMCGLVITTALTVMWGWISHDDLLIRMMPSFMPMQFNTAAMLLLCGASIALLNRYPNLVKIVSVVVVLFESATLAQYALGINFGIDTAFVTPFTDVNTNTIGRMSPDTALALLFSAAAIFLSASNHRSNYVRTLIIIMMSGVVVALAMLPLLGKITGIEAINLNWGHTAEHTAICLLLLSSCVVAQARRHYPGILLSAPTAICVFFIIIAVALSTATRVQEDAKFDALLQTEADNIAHKSQLQLDDLYGALDRIVKRWDAAGGTPRDQWESDASAYVKNFPYLTSLSHADQDTKVLWSLPKRDSSRIIGYQLSSEPVRAEAIGRALATHTAQTTHVLTLRSGEKGFLYISPLYVNDRYDGLQIAAFRLSNFFNVTLDPKELEQVHITIEDEDKRQIFSSLGEGHILSTRWQKTAQIKNKDFVWLIRASPTAEMYTSKNSFVSVAVLIVGLFTAFLISLCSYLLMKSRAHNQVQSKLMGDLAQAEELKQKIIDCSGYMIIAGDIHCNTHTFNRTAEALLGYESHEILGKTPAFWHDLKEVQARAEELTIKLGRPILPGPDVFTSIPLIEGLEEREWTYICKDGSRLPVSLIVTALRDENGAISGFLGIAKDITLIKEEAEQRMIAEAKLRISEERLYLAASGTSDGLWDWNVVSGDLYFSPRFMSELGYEENELPYTIDTFRELIHPDDLEPTFMAVESDHAHHSIYNTEYRLLHKSGDYIWFNARGKTVWDKDDVPVRMTGFVTNIDKRRKAQEALQKTHAELDLIFNNANATIWFKDDKNNLLRVNKAAATAMGGKVEDFENKNCADIFPEHAEKYLNDDLEVINSGKPKLGIIEQFKPINGPPSWISTDKIPYDNKIAGIKGVIAFAVDITELKKSEEQREQLMTKLTEANMELGRFAYVASHDMQEPLRMISNFGALIGKEYGSKLDKNGQEYVQLLTDSARRMQHMVDDLLEYARTGNDVGRFVNVSARQEFKHVLENLSASIRDHKASVTSGELPDFTGNPMQFMRLVQNIIGNALKYQKSDAIPHVYISAEDKGDFWCFSIKDNGIGMNQEFADQIFEPFRRLHSWEEYEGTGIGLAVCKKIVENHGGKIWVTSAPGEGSVFYFTIKKNIGNEKKSESEKATA